MEMTDFCSFTPTRESKTTIERPDKMSSGILNKEEQAQGGECGGGDQVKKVSG